MKKQRRKNVCKIDILVSMREEKKNLTRTSIEELLLLFLLHNKTSLEEGQKKIEKGERN